MNDNRKCYRLEKVAIPFSELKEGDLFILEGLDGDYEDGSIINLALSDAFIPEGVAGGVETVRSEEIGSTRKPRGPWIAYEAFNTTVAKGQVRTYVELRGLTQDENYFYCFDVDPDEGIQARELITLAHELWKKEGLSSAMRGDIDAPVYLDVHGSGGMCADSTSEEAPSTPPSP